MLGLKPSLNEAGVGPKCFCGGEQSRSASEAEDTSADDALRRWISSACSDTLRFRFTWDFCKKNISTVGRNIYYIHTSNTLSFSFIFVISPITVVGGIPFV